MIPLPLRSSRPEIPVGVFWPAEFAVMFRIYDLLDEMGGRLLNIYLALQVGR